MGMRVRLTRIMLIDSKREYQTQRASRYVCAG